MTKKLAQADKDTICARYALGESSPALGKAFNVAPQTIRRMMARRGVERRDTHECHTIRKCDYRFFQNIDSEAKAYWLGFLLADGYIRPRDNAIRITIALHDKDHLERFRQSISSDHPIGVYPNDTKGLTRIPDQSRLLWLARIAIVSKDMIQDLMSHISAARKKDRNEIPKLEPCLMKHFIRGYSDGDGGFSFSVRHPKICNFRISSPVTILKEIQTILMAECSLNRTSITLDSRQVESSGALQYGGINQITRIYHYLYDGTTIWLPRKRDKIARYLNIP